MPNADISVHEAAAILLSLQHWQPLLQGARIEAHTDNEIVHMAFGDKRPKGPQKALAIVDAIEEFVKLAGMELKVNLTEGKDNRLADALSRMAIPRYSGYVKSLTITPMVAERPVPSVMTTEELYRGTVEAGGSEESGALDIATLSTTGPLSTFDQKEDTLAKDQKIDISITTPQSLSDVKTKVKKAEIKKVDVKKRGVQVVNGKKAIVQKVKTMEELQEVWGMKEVVQEKDLAQVISDVDTAIPEETKVKKVEVKKEEVKVVKGKVGKVKEKQAVKEVKKITKLKKAQEAKESKKVKQVGNVKEVEKEVEKDKDTAATPKRIRARSWREESVTAKPPAGESDGELVEEEDPMLKQAGEMVSGGRDGQSSRGNDESSRGKSQGGRKIGDSSVITPRESGIIII
jgi:hypothetical protein